MVLSWGMSSDDQTRPDMSQPSRTDGWKKAEGHQPPTVDSPKAETLLTAQEAAALVGVSRKTVDRRVAATGDRRLPSWSGVRGGKEVRLVSRADVLALWPKKGTRPDMSGHVPTPTAKPGEDRTRQDIQAQALEVTEPTDVAQLRAAAGRVPDLEARIIAEKSRADGAEVRETEARAQVLEERRERRVATAAVLRQLQATRDQQQLGGGAAPSQPGSQLDLFALKEKMQAEVR